jgi:general secretion pathway protein G
MRVVQVRSAVRCAVCHDDLGGRAVACPGCGARGHVDCWIDLGRCPSLGCAVQASLSSSKTEGPEPARPYRGPFPLVELLVGVSIVGLLAAVVVVNVMGQGHGPRVQRPAADMKAIGDALDLFRVDCGYYPASLDELWVRPTNARKWGPEPYLKEYPPKDPWGNEYQYRLVGRDRFEIVSFGADGEPGGQDECTDLSSRTINDQDTSGY